MATRRAVLGDAHVDAAEAAKTEFDTPFQNLVTEAAWGHLWSRDGLTRRERSLLTIALLAALGHWDEYVLHLRASAGNGASEEDIREALMHVAIYAGIPCANHAFRVAKKVLAETRAAEAG